MNKLVFHLYSNIKMPQSMCRYGNDCRRKDHCWFIHPEPEPESKTSIAELDSQESKLCKDGFVNVLYTAPSSAEDAGKFFTTCERLSAQYPDIFLDMLENIDWDELSLDGDEFLSDIKFNCFEISIPHKPASHQFFHQISSFGLRSPEIYTLINDWLLHTETEILTTKQETLYDSEPYFEHDTTTIENPTTEYTSPLNNYFKADNTPGYQYLN